MPRWPYRTLGTLLDRVFRNDLNSNFTDISSDMGEQKARVDNLITATPQPSEVVDARVSDDGTTYGLLKDRLDTEHQSVTAQLADIAIDVKMQGVKGDGVTDDTQAIQNAINSLSNGGTVYFPRTSQFYLITQGLTVPSNVKLISNGATIKSGNARISKGYFTLTSVSNIHIEGFIFDMNMQNLPVYQASDYPNLYNEAIDLESVTNIVIRGNQFINLYTQSIGIHNGGGQYIIEKNIFKSPVQSQQSIINHIYNVTFNGQFNVTDNNFDNDAYTTPANGVCGVMLSGVFGKANISRNRFNYCGRDNTGGHRLGVIDCYGNDGDITISENTALNTCWHFTRLDGVINAMVINNRIHIKIAADIQVIMIACVTQSYNSYNITITGNIIASDVANVYGVGGSITDYSRPFKDILVTNNIFVNIRYGVYFNGVFEGLEISNNIFDGSGQSIQLGLNTSATATNGVTQAQSFIKGIKINGNTMKKSQGISVNFYGYTGSIVSPINICQNQIEGIDTTSEGIVTNGLTPLLIGNVLKTGNDGMFLRNNPVAYLYDNLLYGFTTALNVGSITTLNKANNFHNDAAV